MPPGSIIEWQGRVRSALLLAAERWFVGRRFEATVYFRDLCQCSYFDHRLEWAVPLLAVGWLEYPHRYARGAVPEELATHLDTLVFQSTFVIELMRCAGWHECSICFANGLGRTEVPHSNDNLFIPGNGVIYAAPGGISHYIRVHNYSPPSEFINTALACPDRRSAEYREALREANAGIDAPIWNGGLDCPVD